MPNETRVTRFLEPVQIDDEGRLWLAPERDHWKQVVRERGLTVVIDLEKGLDRGIPTATNDVIYVYFPMADRELPARHKLHAVARLGVDLMRAGERVLVHCELGLNRSALVAGLILVHGGLSGASALARLQERRPGALFNGSFREYLTAQPPGGA